jgi:hypothetical protein
MKLEFATMKEVRKHKWNKNEWARRRTSLEKKIK